MQILNDMKDTQSFLEQNGLSEETMLKPLKLKLQQDGALLNTAPGDTQKALNFVIGLLSAQTKQYKTFCYKQQLKEQELISQGHQIQNFKKSFEQFQTIQNELQGEIEKLNAEHANEIDQLENKMKTLKEQPGVDDLVVKSLKDHNEGLEADIEAYKNHVQTLQNELNKHSDQLVQTNKAFEVNFEKIEFLEKESNQKSSKIEILENE